jgi:hypothetical protein
MAVIIVVLLGFAYVAMRGTTDKPNSYTSPSTRH